MKKKDFKNPPFEIIECMPHYWKEEIGDDFVSFHVTLKTERFSSWLPVQFDFVMSYCQENRPEIGKYYSSVRRNVKGLGPKHSKMFDIMDAEGFDHLPHIHAYINDCIELEKLYERDQNMAKQTPKVQEGAKKICSLESHFPSMKQSALRNETFMDELMDHLNKEALERFPEIFNANPELINEFHGKLINWVRTVGSDMDSLSYRASTENKESE